MCTNANTAWILKKVCNEKKNILQKENDTGMSWNASQENCRICKKFFEDKYSNDKKIVKLEVTATI